MNGTTRIAALALLFAASIPLGGCAHSKPNRVITVKGELTNGPECLMVVQSDGRRYSVTGSVSPFKVGDRVCVRGQVAEMSICMAGEATVSIEAIGPEDNCP